MFQIKVVGVGGCGIHTISRLMEQNLGDIEYIAMDTDVAYLDDINANQTITLESEIFTMLKDNDAEVVNISSLSRARIVSSLRGAEFVFVIGGLGGRTGTIGVPLVAKIAKECGASTIGLVYMPFTFEGMSRRQKAGNSLATLHRIADSVMVIENDRALKVIKESMPLSALYQKMDVNFSNVMRLMVSLKSDTFASRRVDIRKLFQAGTRLYTGTALVKSDIENNCTKALENAWMELDLVNVLAMVILTEIGLDVDHSTVKVQIDQLRARVGCDVPCWQKFKQDATLGNEIRLTILIVQRNIS